jgi:hypothetical protein
VPAPAGTGDAGPSDWTGAGVEPDSVGSPQQSQDTVTILLVEDERALREIVKRQLTRHGYRVISAGDGVEALEVAMGEKVDLVITDVIMPKMKGNELVMELAAICPDAKVIFMSGYTPFDLDQADMTTLLHKPFSEADLMDHIHGALGADDPTS